MKLRKQFRQLVFCAMLGMASLAGANMRPEEIEDLMHTMNVPVVAHTLRDHVDTGDDPEHPPVPR